MIEHVVGWVSRQKFVVPLASLCLALIACDTTATFQISEVQFDPAAPFTVVSATPTKADPATGNHVPACSTGDAVTGFRLDFVLKSTEHKGSLKGNNDVQVREGDRVGGNPVTVGPGQSLSAESFSFGPTDTLDEAAAFSGVGTAKKQPKAVPISLTFEARNTNRKTAVAVAVLVDHSGSMLGFVDPFYHFETKTPVAKAIDTPTDFQRSRFSAGGSDLISRLNASDKLIAWTFNEAGVKLACNMPGVDELANDTERETGCFGTNHEWVYDAATAQGAFNILTSQGEGALQEEGRSPLWEAVSHAWAFLNENAATLTKHIVVVTDSPDTCTGSWVVPDVDPCSANPVSYSQFVSTVGTTPDEQRIPVSFIQVQSEGYQYPDPAQLEIACMTGGTYQWIENLAFAKTGDDLQQTFRKSYANIRNTLGGVWHLFVEMASLDATLPPGQLIALDGSLTLTTELLAETKAATFRDDAIPDTRLLLRKTCADESTCGNEGEACRVSCLPEGSMCANPLFEPRPSDGTECCCGAQVSSDEAQICDSLAPPCCEVLEANDPQHNFDCEEL